MRVTNFFEMYMETSKVKPAEPAPIETKESFTRAEVEQLINEKVKEVLKSITPTTESDTPTVETDTPTTESDTPTVETE